MVGQRTPFLLPGLHYVAGEVFRADACILCALESVDRKQPRKRLDRGNPVSWLLLLKVLVSMDNGVNIRPGVEDRPMHVPLDAWSPLRITILPSKSMVTMSSGVIAGYGMPLGGS